MKKLAIFVEGKTERLFVDRLLVEIFGKKNIHIDHTEISGGARAPRQVTILRASQIEEGKRYYVLISDCGGDHQVAQRIREEHQGLTDNNYSLIIGVRDVAPDFTHAQIPQLELGLVKNVDTSLVPVNFVLSVMELESWFLSEFNHFPKISPLLDHNAIQTNLGFCPKNDDMELRNRPSHDIHECYQIVGKSYNKPAERTIEAIDYEYLYLEVTLKVPSLKKLIDLIDGFI